MPPQADLKQLLIMLALLAVEAVILGFFLIVGGFAWRAFRRTWRRGLLFGGLAAALGLPSAILGIIYVDVTQFGPGQPPEMIPVIKVIAGVVALAIVIGMIPLRGLYYHVAVAEWSRVRVPESDALAGPPGTRLPGFLAGCGVGVVMLVATLAIFYWAGVKEGEGIDEMRRLFPGLMDLSPWVVLAVALPFYSAAAIVEEMIFRGGMLGFFLRITGNGTLVAWALIAGVSLLWAILHVPNTDSPVLKVSQIFIIGLALGGMMRHWGLGSAMAAHVTLNVGAVIGELLFPGI